MTKKSEQNLLERKHLIIHIFLLAQCDVELGAEIGELLNLIFSALTSLFLSGRCQSAIHVYRDRPPITADKQLGHKVYRYKNCRASGCGPNYCCCRFF